MAAFAYMITAEFTVPHPDFHGQVQARFSTINGTITSEQGSTRASLTRALLAHIRKAADLPEDYPVKIVVFDLQPDEL